jgi:minor extracellular protease Epr
MHTILIQVHPQVNMSPLKRHPSVLRVETDHRIKLHVLKKKSAVKGKACASITSPEIIPWGVARIQALQIWKRTQGKPIRVAVLDTGIAQHPDLHMTGSFKAIDNEPAADFNGHGTHVSGTITALRNRFGVVGVAPRVKLYAVKAFNRNGTAYTSDIIQGIDWCIRNKMQVINMSFGMSDFNASLQDIIRKAYRQGIVMVVSAGNNGAGSGNIDYPARFSETIAVAATTLNNKIADFSNRGSGISVAAPGESICSTYPNKSYQTLSGTSMAAPHVTGTVALLLSRKSNLTPAKVKQRLQKTAQFLQGYSSKIRAAV